MVARALERVGDRWSLLVIRDLLTGDKRFTDLMDRLGGITPKTLTQRLRELEDAGIVSADREPGRREVWYRLTPAGQDLGPVIDGLSWWGLRHAWRRPEAGEQLHPEHLLRSALRAIEHSADDRVPDDTSADDKAADDKAADVQGPALWHFRLDGADYLAESDGHRWSLAARAPSGPADVTITATRRALAGLIFTGSDEGVDIVGDDGPTRRFRRLIGTMAATVRASA
jgi:DNA-binding HxlR family transcriptional regulator